MVKVIYEEQNHRAAAYDDNQLVGECTFITSALKWTIDHTRVETSHDGLGIARHLVEEVVHQARIAGVKIDPVCEYAQKQFEKRLEYADVWFK